MTAQIRLPANPGVQWLADYNRNVERAINDTTAALTANSVTRAKAKFLYNG